MRTVQPRTRNEHSADTRNELSADTRSEHSAAPHQLWAPLEAAAPCFPPVEDGGGRAASRRSDLCLHVLGAALTSELPPGKPRAGLMRTQLVAGRSRCWPQAPGQRWQRFCSRTNTVCAASRFAHLFFSLSSSVAFTPNTKVGLSLTHLLVYPPCRASSPACRMTTLTSPLPLCCFPFCNILGPDSLQKSELQPCSVQVWFQGQY